MKPRSFASMTAFLALALVPTIALRADDSKKPPANAPAPASAPAPAGAPAPAAAKLPDGPKTSGGGRITIDKPVLDVGDVIRGTPANAVFEIKNTGTDVLKILSAKPG